MWLLKFLFYLFVFLLFIGLIVLSILFVTSPFTWDKLNPGTDTSLTHAVTGDAVNIPFKEVPHVLKRSIRTKQMELLESLTNCLRDNNCPYWAVKSTLLATIRHGQLIPWDDAISIAILHDNLRNLVHLRPTLEQSGAALLKHGKHAYYYCANNLAQYPYVEINIMQPKEHEISVCTPTDELGQCSFADAFRRRHEVFPRESVFPLRATTLGSATMYVPQKAEECLTVCFGENWQKESFWDTKTLVNNHYTKGLVRRLLPNYL